MTDPRPIAGEPAKVSDEIEDWSQQAGKRTLGSLIERFSEKSFALLFILLLGVPALPLPTGGATHVLELVAALLALQLIVGRRTIWLPQRWRRLELAGAGRRRFIARLLKTIRWLERYSRPRLHGLFGHRASNSVFGLMILTCCAGAFLAPPFTGLDTLPALGAVLISLGVLLEDVLFVAAGTAIAAGGIVLEVVLGKAVFDAARNLL
jgi:hypothetical protein